jgi:hypothetical protein
VANFPPLGLCGAGLPRHSPLQLSPCIYKPKRYYLARNTDKLQTWRNHGDVSVAVLHRNTGLFMEVCTGFAEHLSHNFPTPHLHLPECSADVDTGPPTHLLHTLPLSFAVVAIRINGVHTQPNTEVTVSIMLIVPSAEYSLFNIQDEHKKSKRIPSIFKDECTGSCICLWKLTVAVATYVSICIV